MRLARYAASTAESQKIDAVPHGHRVRAGATAAWIGETLRFSTEGLESYFFSGWRPDLFDLLVVAGAIEFCDVSYGRPELGWSRNFDVRVAVHDPRLWNSPSVLEALADAAGFLTGDVWKFDFVSRKRDEARPGGQGQFELPTGARIIMPYSDGLDSRAVAAIVEAKEKTGLVRVRLGSFGADRRSHNRRARPFMMVPYEVKLEKRARRESSARSRAFKFAVVTGIAAALAQVDRIIVTESGQGALGPVLAVTGQAYPDYRVHPAFTARMERLFKTLLNKSIHFEYPRLWKTKGQTLADAHALGTFEWLDTRSCWQSSRQTGFEGRRRQCGVCAACMLRRMSMHTAKLMEPASTYIWENLSAQTIAAGAVAGFANHTPAMEEYAIAGVLHLDHLAEMADNDFFIAILSRAAGELSRALQQSQPKTLQQLKNLLAQHRHEWQNFLATLHPKSFVRHIALSPVT
jgi:7-cyano-7-deazaguanine synthase in queuosine biosynthesis